MNLQPRKEQLRRQWIDTMFEGVTIGVVTGIVLSLFFGARDIVRGKLERNNQIKYLARTIAVFRDEILDIKTDVEVLLGDKRHLLTKDNLRKARFDDMRRQIDSILQNRSSRLSYDEKRSVNDVFYTDFYPTVVLNEKAYDAIFKRLEEIEWLHLPTRRT